MTTKPIPAKIKNNVLMYKSLLRKEGIGKVRIILFGSVAKGIYDEYSDIDLAVVSPRFGKNYHQELIKLMSLAHKVNQPLEPYPFHPRDLDDKYSALSNEIKKYGVEIK